jgi:hypothetical protein
VRENSKNNRPGRIWIDNADRTLDTDDLLRIRLPWGERSISGGLVFWPFTARSRSPRVSDAHALYRKGQEQLKIASREVAESERIVAQWSTLIDAMRADGRDVTVACDLLKTFKDNLDVRRSNRDLF